MSSALAQPVPSGRSVTSADGVLLQEVRCPERVTHTHKDRVSCAVSTREPAQIERIVTAILAPAKVRVHTAQDARSLWGASVPAGGSFVTWQLPETVTRADDEELIVRSCELPDLQGTITPFCSLLPRTTLTRPLNDSSCLPLTVGAKPLAYCRPSEDR